MEYLPFEKRRELWFLFPELLSIEEKRLSDFFGKYKPYVPAFLQRLFIFSKRAIKKAYPDGTFSLGGYLGENGVCISVNVDCSPKTKKGKDCQIWHLGADCQVWHLRPEDWQNVCYESEWIDHTKIVKEVTFQLRMLKENEEYEKDMEIWLKELEKDLKR